VFGRGLLGQSKRHGLPAFLLAASSSKLAASLHHLPQHIVQDAAVFVVLHFRSGIQP